MKKQFSDQPTFLTSPEDDVFVDVPKKKRHRRKKVVRPTAVKLNQTTLYLNENDSFQLVVKILPEKATNKNIIWCTSDSSVATVSASGLVVAKSGGTAIISAISEFAYIVGCCVVNVLSDKPVVEDASSERSYSDQTIVEEKDDISSLATPDSGASSIVPVTSIAINRKKITIVLGTKYKLKATLYPENATNQNIYWRSSSNYIASVSYKGVVKTHFYGDIIISAISEDGYCIAHCIVSVVDATDRVRSYYDDDAYVILPFSYADHKYSTEIYIPDDVAIIASNAFVGCSSLETITIPDSVTYLGSRAFTGCHNLKSVVLSNRITSINDFTFDNCFALTSITIPDSVIYINKYAFTGCRSLKTITIPDSVVSIGTSSFSDCKSLESIVLSKNLTSIPGYAFKNCESLKSITIPSSVTSIDTRAFASCHALTSVEIEDGLTSIGELAFSVCNSLTSINIPDTVTSIGYGALFRCSSLKSITIPDSVTSIGGVAFCRCSSLQTITLPNSITSIEKSTFSNCLSLKSITIPNSVTSISSNAFKECPKLKDVYFKGTKEEWDSITFEDEFSDPANSGAIIHFNS